MATVSTKSAPFRHEYRADLPGHLELPDYNDEIVQNYLELPQAIILSQSIWPVLEHLHPDGYFAIGQDCGIYWRVAEPPEPLYRGAICPDWSYVPNVPPNLDGHFRRSYVLWKELIPPAVVLEFASADGQFERDQTPRKGKFWIYEQVVKAEYYGIIVVATGEFELHRLVDGRYQRIQANVRGNFEVETMGVALGVWHGSYFGETSPWLRWSDASGNLLPIPEEQLEGARARVELERTRADREQQKADQAVARADREQQKADRERTRSEEAQARAEREHQLIEEERLRGDRLAAKLRDLGIDPDQV